MRVDIERQQREILKKHRYYQRYIVILLLLSVFVASAVSISLIKPAESLACVCGQTAHTHGEDCYRLICERNVNVDEETGEETPHIHSLDQDCFDMSETICGMDEHEHVYECFAHDDDEKAPDMLTAEEIAEFDPDSNGSGTDETAEDGETPDEAPEESEWTEENGEDTDETEENNESDEDDVLPEPVLTEVPADEFTTTETAAAVPEDEEVMLVTGGEAEHKMSDDITIAAGSVASVSNNGTKYTNVELRNIYHAQDNNIIQHYIVIDNKDTTNAMVAKDGENLGSNPNVPATAVNYNATNTATKEINKKSSIFNDGDMRLKITFEGGKYMTAYPAAYRNNKKPGKANKITGSKVNNDGSNCDISYDIFKNGTLTSSNQVQRGYFYVDVTNDQYKPTFIIPLKPLEANQRYEISNDIFLDPEWIDGFGKTNWNIFNSENNINVNVNVELTYITSDGQRDTITANSTNWKADSGLGFTNFSYTLDRNINGEHEYGSMLCTLTFLNSKKLDLGNTAVLCDLFATISKLEVHEDKGTVRTYEIDKGGSGYGQFKSVPGIGRQFQFNDGRDSNKYHFKFCINYKVSVGRKTGIYCHLYGNCRDFNAPNNNENQMHSAYTKNKDRLTGEPFEYSIDPYMHARIQKSTYYEPDDDDGTLTDNLGGKAYHADTLFQFDFGFEHTASNNCADKTFICAFTKESDKTEITPDKDNIKIYAYYEYTQTASQSDWVKDDALDYYKGDLVNPSYYTAKLNENKDIEIKFNGDYVNAVKNSLFYTAEIIIVIEADIYAGSLDVRQPGTPEKITNVTAEGIFGKTSAKASVTVGKSFFIFDNRQSGMNKSEIDTVHSLSFARDSAGLKWSIEQGNAAKYFNGVVTFTVKIPPGLEMIETGWGKDLGGVNGQDGLMFKVHDEINNYKYDPTHWGWISPNYWADEGFSGPLNKREWTETINGKTYRGELWTFTVDTRKNRYLQQGKQFRITIQTKLKDKGSYDDYETYLKRDDGIKKEDTKFALFDLVAEDSITGKSTMSRHLTQKIPLTEEEAEMTATAQLASDFGPRVNTKTDEVTGLVKYSFLASFHGKPGDKTFVFEVDNGQIIDDTNTNPVKVYRTADNRGFASVPDITNSALVKESEEKNGVTQYNYQKTVNNNKVTINFNFDGGHYKNTNTTYNKVKVEFYAKATKTCYPDNAVKFTAKGKIERKNDEGVISELANTEASINLGGYELYNKDLGQTRTNNTVTHEYEDAEANGLTWVIEGYSSNYDAGDMRGVVFKIKWPEGVKFSGSPADYKAERSEDGVNWAPATVTGGVLDSKTDPDECDGYFMLYWTYDQGDAKGIHDARRFRITFTAYLDGLPVYDNNTHFADYVITVCDEIQVNDATRYSLGGEGRKQTKLQRISPSVAPVITGFGQCINYTPNNDGAGIQGIGELEYTFSVNFFGTANNMMIKFDIEPVDPSNSNEISEDQIKDKDGTPPNKGPFNIRRTSACLNGRPYNMKLGSQYKSKTRAASGSGTDALVIDEFDCSTRDQYETYNVTIVTTGRKNDSSLKAGFNVTLKLYDKTKSSDEPIASYTATAEIGRFLLARVWDFNDEENINARPVFLKDENGNETDGQGGLGKDGYYVSRKDKTVHDWLDLKEYKPENGGNMHEIVWAIQCNPVTWMQGYNSDNRVIVISIVGNGMVWDRSNNIKLYTIETWYDEDWCKDQSTEGMTKNLKPVPEDAYTISGSSGKANITLGKNSEIVTKQLRFVIIVPVGINAPDDEATYSIQVTSGSSAYSSYVFTQSQTITHIPRPPLPATGGKGTKRYIDIGAAMIACSVTMVMLKKHRRKRKK